MRILKYIIYTVIPAVSAFLAANDEIIVWLIDNHVLSQKLNVSLFQSLCLCINVLFTVLIINGELINSQRKNEHYRKEIAGLYNIVKLFAQSTFVAISKNNNFNFDLRIFVPEINIIRWIKDSVCCRKKEKWFVIRNIEPFAKKDITEHLRFRVDPDPQGLVGEAYKSGSIVYDDTLEITNINYSLGQNQLNRTSNLRWSICVPISNEKNEIVAIMAFDSDSSNLDIKKNKNEIKNMTNTIAIMLRDSVPELFDRKWRIL